MMSAVDGDLLEEAQRPLKAKQPWLPVAIGAAACIAVIAAVSLRPPVAEEPPAVQLANPLQSVSVTQIEELGYELPLPADAQEPSYFLIDLGAEQTLPMAEVRFERNGGEYACRTLKTASSEDISGLYAQWEETYVWNVETLDVTVMEAEDLTACVSWYEPESETQWCLSGTRGAADLLDTAGEILHTLGYDLDVAPEGAASVAFRVIALEELTVGETSFVLNGTAYAYRMAATNLIEDPFADISGVEASFTVELPGEIGWCAARLSFDPGKDGKIVWFDPAPGLLYSLYMQDNASEEALLEMAERVYTPAQDDAG
jgi:hypothetical protein